MTSRPMYHPHPPGPLMERLFISFRLADRFVSYPRQEAPMLATADPRDALYAEFLEEVRALRALCRQAAAREQRIRGLWAEIEALEAQRRGQRAAAGGTG